MEKNLGDKNGRMDEVKQNVEWDMGNRCAERGTGRKTYFYFNLKFQQLFFFSFCYVSIKLKWYLRDLLCRGTLD